MDILTKPKIRLLTDHPFYASFLYKMRTELTHSVKKAVSDGKTIRINPEYFESLTEKQRLTLLAKPANHVMFMHNLRRGSRNLKQWNEACSYCVNSMLAQAGFEMPDEAQYDPDYDDLSAEKIYDILEQKKQNQGGGNQQQPQMGMAQGQSQDDTQQGSNDDGDSQQDDNGQGQQSQWQPGDGFGDIEDFPGDTEEQKEQEQEIKETLVAAMHAAKQAGKLPAGMERILEDLLNPVLDWKTLLRQFLVQSKNDYSFKFPNRRHTQRGMYLPSVYSQEIGNFSIIVDTSGSISYEELQELASEVKDIAESSQSETTVMYVDSRLAHVETFAPGDEIELHPEGGGGTDFCPGFEYIEEHGLTPQCVIYFTDGYCDSFPEEPDYPVIWVIKDNKNFEPPFGDKIDF